MARRIALWTALAGSAALASSWPTLLISTHNASRASCLEWVGVYGRPLHHIWHYDASSCQDDSLQSGEGYVVELSPNLNTQPEATLVWLQSSGVNQSLATRLNARSFDESIDFLERSLRNPGQTHDQLSELGRYQTHFGQDGNRNVLDADRTGKLETVPFRIGVQIVWRAQDNALVAVDRRTLPHLDKFLDPFVAAVAISTVQDISKNRGALPSFNSAIPVPNKAIAKIQALLHTLKFSPDIASVLSTLSVPSMLQDIKHLTGEDGQGILSRHSFSQGARQAADWIQAQFEKFGATCRQEKFLDGFAPNVICAWPFTGKSTDLTLLSAHYDSRGTFGSTRAPGANDDGSGTTHLLAIARAIQQNSVKFRSPVQLVAFAGEEQGLLGSNAYARKLREEGKNITLMIQADMLAYHSPAEPPQLGFPEFIGLKEAAYLLGNISRIYAPDLTVGTTPACCSDHQSFHYQGFPSTQVYERAGPIIDPFYHNSEDLSEREGYDMQQVRSIAKVTFAAILIAAGFDL